jgi:hypothetical protein
MLKDVKSLTAIIGRAKVSGQQIRDEHKKILDIEFPDMLKNIEKHTKNLNIKGIKEEMEKIEKKKNDDFEAKIKDTKIEE